MRHTLRETLSGLRRNFAVTISVIVTFAVSLTLFGAGLLAAQEVDLIKGRWYDRIEISVYLCVKDSKGGNCKAGQATTEAERAHIEEFLKNNSLVERVEYESQKQAFEEYRRVFKNHPLRNVMKQEQLADSFRVKLKDPKKYEGLVDEASLLPGVSVVQDLHVALDRIFSWLNVMRWGTLGMSTALLLAAALQIVNTIRISAFTRRREIGIMRLVGASNSYIMLPFLLESLICGLVGALAACGLISGLIYLIVNKVSLQAMALPWIGWSEGWLSMGWVICVGILLSIVPTLLATRKYLKV